MSYRYNSRRSQHSTEQSDQTKSISPERLRGIAFAMLARREHSQKEMRTKLISYGADKADVDALLAELSERNYQSDERMSGVLLRESLRKGQGKRRLQHTLKKHNISADMLEEELADVDWLVEAVRLRCKRFGEELPIDQKQKARQLRFLQYRGFGADVCYKAIKMTLDDLEVENEN